MMSGRFDLLPPTQEMLRQRGASAHERALHERLSAIVDRHLTQAQEDRASADSAREARRREIQANVVVALQARESRDATRTQRALGSPGDTQADARKVGGGGAPKG